MTDLKIISAAFAVIALAGSAAADEMIFKGYDPLWRASTVVIKRDGQYYMDGAAMDVIRHRNMPTDGLSLALQSRIGKPDNYFLILGQRLEIYSNCEFGPCRKKRSVQSEIEQ